MIAMGAEAALRAGNPGFAKKSPNAGRGFPDTAKLPHGTAPSTVTASRARLRTQVICGCSVEERRAIRQEKSGAIAADLEPWLRE